MGRVAKYKKVKSFDPYSKKNRGALDLSKVGIWGLGDDGRKIKKRSQKAERLYLAKQARADKRGGGKNKKQHTTSTARAQAAAAESRDFFDAAPSAFHDEFDMQDLVGSVKKQNIDTVPEAVETIVSLPVSASASASAAVSGTENNDGTHITTTEDTATEASTTEAAATKPPPPHAEEEEEWNVTKLLRLEQQDERQQQKQQHAAHGRRDGESKRAYHKRTKLETNLLIKESQMKSGTRNPERRKLKKEFLNNKKKNKKRKTNKFFNYQADKDGTDTGTGAAAAEETEARTYFGNHQPEEKSFSTYADDYVRFGEQATRPPQFQNIPRGASKSKNANNINVRMQHHTNHTTRRKEEEGGGHSATTAKTTTTTMSNAQVQAEHDAMELMKRKIQAQYRAIKVKRQQHNRY